MPVYLQAAVLQRAETGIHSDGGGGDVELKMQRNARGFTALQKKDAITPPPKKADNNPGTAGIFCYQQAVGMLCLAHL